MLCLPSTAGEALVMLLILIVTGHKPVLLSRYCNNFHILLGIVFHYWNNSPRLLGIVFHPWNGFPTLVGIVFHPRNSFPMSLRIVFHSWNNSLRYNDVFTENLSSEIVRKLPLKHLINILVKRFPLFFLYTKSQPQKVFFTLTANIPIWAQVLIFTLYLTLYNELVK